ncbi:MAG: BadF/BadG/BcrA/BcrD ATPase family protein [Brevinematia bacterium]
MAYYCGIDGGGTKTHCVIGDEKNIISEFIASGSNYHITGLENSKKNIEKAFNEALKKAKISKKEIKFSVLGLSGADRDEDIKKLTKTLYPIFGKNFKIFNDCWIALKNGIRDYYGIVAVCGTGGGYAGRTKDGKEFIYRNLDYITGNRGGGTEIAEKALHFAFRSEEGSYKKTALEEKIPELFQVKNMAQVLEKIFMKEIDKKILDKIPPLVFLLAEKNDEVCIEILTELGKTISEYLQGLINHLHFEGKIPTILSGSIFKTKNKTLISTIRNNLPSSSEIIIPDTPPVFGAYKLAIDHSIDFS